jgi:hypothetical protein
VTRTHFDDVILFSNEIGDDVRCTRGEHFLGVLAKSGELIFFSFTPQSETDFGKDTRTWTHVQAFVVREGGGEGFENCTVEIDLLKVAMGRSIEKLTKDKTQ